MAKKAETESAKAQAALFQPAPLPVASLDAAERMACLRLIRSENVGAVTFRELINHFGGAARAIDALPELSRRGGRARAIKPCALEDAEAELERAAKAGATPVFTIEPGYPAALAATEAPPPLLYVKGRAELLNRPAVAIVGSRQCSAAGAKLAGVLSRDLAAAGYVIVSGLARGIDRVSHEMALNSGTVAVLAGGVDTIYPPEHAALQARIAAEGCLVSERPAGFEARGKDFPRRNRIISGMSLAVVVVEAAARSGTLTTARFAAEQGREVFAVPGHPLDPRAEGTNKLIKSGATLVTEAGDVIEALRPISGLAEADPSYRLSSSGPAKADGTAERHQSSSRSSASTIPTVDDAARASVLAALGPAPADVDAIVRTTDLPIRLVQITLMELDLAGRLDRPGPGLIALKVDENG